MHAESLGVLRLRFAEDAKLRSGWQIVGALWLSKLFGEHVGGHADLEKQIPGGMTERTAIAKAGRVWKLR